MQLTASRVTQLVLSSSAAVQLNNGAPCKVHGVLFTNADTTQNTLIEMFNAAGTQVLFRAFLSGGGGTGVVSILLKAPFIADQGLSFQALLGTPDALQTVTVFYNNTGS